MKIYIHSNNGYNEEVCIVQAENEDIATTLVLNWLDEHGFTTSPLNLREINEPNSIIFQQIL